MSAVREPRPLASEPARVDSPYLTASEAASYLRFASVRTLYQGIKTEGIPYLKRGRTLLFHRDQLDRWLAGEPVLRLMREQRERRG